ncbi:hypothetical protein RF11_09739 [Thelohanellus kitauei]|uniref:Uncharacterized protein n=1 Tax=Thelohanellus kitauei TaxID=669202 RepID=A0A0C2MRM9_THEKT|nr:hypothetical protein RF11_09739 [Thelohanellus kitauei]
MALRHKPSYFSGTCFEKQSMGCYGCCPQEIVKLVGRLVSCGEYQKKHWIFFVHFRKKLTIRQALKFFPSGTTLKKANPHDEIELFGSTNQIAKYFFKWETGIYDDGLSQSSLGEKIVKRHANYISQRYANMFHYSTHRKNTKSLIDIDDDFSTQTKITEHFGMMIASQTTQSQDQTEKLDTIDLSSFAVFNKRSKQFF